MDVRTDSWHYRLFKMTYNRGLPPSKLNLCRYFWKVVWGGTIFALLVSLGGMVLGGVVSLVYLYPIKALMVLGVVVGGAGLIVFLFWVGEKFDQWYYSLDRLQKEPGLIRSYLKAKKDKVCPLITFQDAPGEETNG